MSTLRFSITAVLTVWMATVRPTSASTPEPLLYALPSESVPVELARQLTETRPEVTGRVFADVNASALAAASAVRVDLFGADTVLEHLSSEVRSEDRYTWIGRVHDQPASLAVFVVNAERVTGYVECDRGTFELAPLEDGAHAFLRIDPAAMLPLAEPVDPPQLAPLRSESRPPASRSAASSHDDDLDTITILVVYTRAAERALVDVESTVDLEIAVTNLVLANSGVSTRVRLAGLVRTDYEEHVENMSWDLNYLWGTDDGYMDEVHALRDQLEADVVSLISDSRGYCGIAKRLTDLSIDNDRYAFNVIRWSCTRIALRTFTHELGHNLGSGHDHETGCQGIFPHACGHRHEKPGGWRTVMAYGCAPSAGGCPAIPFFSNPMLDHDGIPIGISAGEPRAADNAATLAATTPTVASFRGTSIAPRDVTVTTGRFDAVRVDWSPATASVSGYRVHRFASPSSEVPAASWDVSSSPFHDTTADFGTPYTYRVAGVTHDSIEGGWSPRFEGVRVDPECGRPVSGPRSGPGEPPLASDCLFLLGASVGSTTCPRPCVCDVTGANDPGITGKDVLLCLAAAAGQPIAPLDCRCGVETNQRERRE